MFYTILNKNHISFWTSSQIRLLIDDSANLKFNYFFKFSLKNNPVFFIKIILKCIKLLLSKFANTLWLILLTSVIFSNYLSTNSSSGLEATIYPNLKSSSW
jgi:hypothetical protein